MAEKKKIVMIDDEPDLCLLVKDNLEGTGEFDIITVTDPQDALELCRREKPNLILLDIVMPKIKGTDLVKAIRGVVEIKKTPIVIISGLGEIVYFRKKGTWRWLPNRPVVLNRGEVIHEKDLEKAAAAYKVEGYITKPFTTEGLLEVIRDVLKRSEAVVEEDGDAGIS